MPYCPACRSEYRASAARCADCGVELVPELPRVDPPSAWTEVFRGETLRTDVIRAALETAGIETVAPDDMTSNLGWYAPSAIGMIRLFVRETDLGRAREIIQGLDRLGDEPPAAVPDAEP